jgi:hypothetical protein
MQTQSSMQLIPPQAYDGMIGWSTPELVS